MKFGKWPPPENSNNFPFFQHVLPRQYVIGGTSRLAEYRTSTPPGPIQTNTDLSRNQYIHQCTGKMWNFFFFFEISLNITISHLLYLSHLNFLRCFVLVLCLLWPAQLGPKNNAPMPPAPQWAPINPSRKNYHHHPTLAREGVWHFLC